MADEAKTFPGKKILIVDDDRDIVEALQTALSGLGVEVFTAWALLDSRNRTISVLFAFRA